MAHANVLRRKKPKRPYQVNQFAEPTTIAEDPPEAVTATLRYRQRAEHSTSRRNEAVFKKFRLRSSDLRRIPGCDPHCTKKYHRIQSGVLIEIRLQMLLCSAKSSELSGTRPQRPYTARLEARGRSYCGRYPARSGVYFCPCRPFAPRCLITDSRTTLASSTVAEPSMRAIISCWSRTPS